MYLLMYHTLLLLLLPGRVGAWYMVKPQEDGCEVEWRKEMVDKAEPKVRILQS